MFRIERVMTRVQRLREKLGWSQRQMAAFLKLGQSAVARMEAGQREQGPTSLVLDQLDADFGDLAGRHPDKSGAELGAMMLAICDRVAS